MTKYLFSRPDTILEPLYIVTVIYNSPRWRVRWKLYQDFAKRCEEAGAILYTVEVAFGNREFSITEANNPCHIQLRTNSEIWHKEAALNAGVARLPAGWQYVAWIDADITFARDDWADEAKHRLQHYDIIQMFSEAADISDNYEIVSRYQGLGYCFVRNIPWTPSKASVSTYYGQTVAHIDDTSPFDYIHHPGLAWACTRKCWNTVGGLFDKAIIGEADYLMARAILGHNLMEVRKNYTISYKRYIQAWANRALLLNKNMGYMAGTVLHHWHGAKVNRKYYDRTKLLVATQYDPDIDLTKDWQGLWQLTNRSPELRDGIRNYGFMRNEDAPYEDKNF